MLNLNAITCHIFAAISAFLQLVQKLETEKSFNEVVAKRETGSSTHIATLKKKMPYRMENLLSHRSPLKVERGKSGSLQRVC